MVLFVTSLIFGIMVLLSLVLIMIIIGRHKTEYEQRIDDEEQLAFIEEYRKKKLEKTV